MIGEKFWKQKRFMEKYLFLYVIDFLFWLFYKKNHLRNGVLM